VARLLDAAPVRLDARRAGYALGLGMSLTSPWNIGFWLAVMGRPEVAEKGIAASLVMAGAVLSGALAWCLVLIAMLSLLRLRIDAAWWEIVANGATGLMMLGFAIAGLARFAG
jgi:threonine/homoserine/homoserine lactone efflux protein